MDHLQNWVDANASWVSFVSLVVGVLALLTGFLFYRWSRRPKRFGYQVMSSTPILSHFSQNLPLKVNYDGEEVVKPNLLVVKAGNVGKASIQSRDFDGGVRIGFKQSRLLAVSVTDTSDPDLVPEFIQSENKVIFTPSLLISGEWINFQFITDGPLELPNVEARIADQTGPVKQIREFEVAPWRPLFYVGFILAVGGLLLQVVAALVQAPGLEGIATAGWWATLIGFAVVLGVLFMGTWKEVSWVSKL